ncbi:MAG: endonuclease/exonuclease/phosphatase family protein [FCB group bacterium]|nr:endonuclease/exonuclease/phosphatase family protein [FCB group bacterium]
MRKKIIVFFELTLSLAAFSFFVWKYLPPDMLFLEVILSNLAVKFVAGVSFIVFTAILIFLRKKFKTTAALSLAFSGLLIFEVLSYHIPAGNQVELAGNKSFTLLSFNVKYDGLLSPELLDIVRHLDPGVIAFQEFAADHVRQFDSSLKQMGYSAAIDTASPSVGAFAYAVYSKFPLRNHVLLNTKGPYWKTRWPFQGCEFLFTGQWIKIVNLHVIPPNNSIKGLFPYAPQLKLIPAQLRTASEYSDNGTQPAIICGDLNQTPSSKFLAVIRDCFIDSWEESGSGFGFTWMNPKPMFKIDYIFHSPHLKSISSGKVKNSFSDHHGLITRYILINQSPDNR